MAKTKNHTAHNQTRKNHRNGECSAQRAAYQTTAWSDFTNRILRGRMNGVTPRLLVGIKKPKPQRYGSLRGVDPKFLRNQRYALKGTQAARGAKEETA